MTDSKRERLSLSLDQATMDRLLSLSQEQGLSTTELLRAAFQEFSEARRPREWTTADILTAKEVPGYAQQFLPPVLLNPQKKKPSISTTALIVPRRKVDTGTLVHSVSFLWRELADQLSDDWTLAYKMPADKLEELIAGAFKKDGFDEVILTPRSGDHGRDIIATKRGIGSVKIIGSVKRYAVGNRVRYDDVRALIGVLHGDQSSSKGMLITTSDFPKRVLDDPLIKPFIPTRLELVNGAGLRAWINRLRS